jgi:17beta-estradiol 17-dehydrogenase / very-long-chain 3-oxoacyl-CoA reductase
MVLQVIWKCFLMKRKDLIKRYGEKSWAIVTGGSEGIGWEFCQQIAKTGFNVIIVARNQKTLTERENYLKELYPEQEFMTISADFSEASTTQWYEDFIAKLGDRDVSMLVNNVGRMIGTLSANSDQDILDVFLTNTCPAVMLTKMIGEKMHYRDDRSAIINVGSQFCCFPSADNSVYASSKALIRNFTLGEGQNHTDKIDLLLAEPGFTQTAMMQGKSHSL